MKEYYWSHIIKTFLCCPSDRYFYNSVRLYTSQRAWRGWVWHLFLNTYIMCLSNRVERMIPVKNTGDWIPTLHDSLRQQSSFTSSVFLIFYTHQVSVIRDFFHQIIFIPYFFYSKPLRLLLFLIMPDFSLYYCSWHDMYVI